MSSKDHIHSLWKQSQEDPPASPVCIPYLKTVFLKQRWAQALLFPFQRQRKAKKKTNQNHSCLNQHKKSLTKQARPTWQSWKCTNLCTASKGKVHHGEITSPPYSPNALRALTPKEWLLHRPLELQGKPMPEQLDMLRTGLYTKHLVKNVGICLLAWSAI